MVHQSCPGRSASSRETSASKHTNHQRGERPSVQTKSTAFWIVYWTTVLRLLSSTGPASRCATQTAHLSTTLVTVHSAPQQRSSCHTRQCSSRNDPKSAARGSVCRKVWRCCSTNPGTQGGGKLRERSFIIICMWIFDLNKSIGTALQPATPQLEPILVRHSSISGRVR